MQAGNYSTTASESKRALTLLQLLWKKFRRQPFLHKIVTLLVIIITFLFLIVFFSSFLIWQAFMFISSKTIFAAIEWYLHYDDAKYQDFEKER